MSMVDDPSSHGQGAQVFAFDGDADAVVGEHRSERTAGLTGRDRLGVLCLGGGFLVVALALSFFVGHSSRAPGLIVVGLYVGLYAAVSRVEFEVFTGASVPTQLVLVPMLFVLPLALVPLAVAAGLMLGSVVDRVGGRVSLERGARVLVGGWHAAGAVAVLALAGEQSLSWSHWPLYVAALAGQFAAEFASVAVGEWIAHGTKPAELLPHLARVQMVDAMLAPVGLVFAFAARAEAYTLLLVVPLVALLRVFARERLARIDNALELSTAYRGTAFLLGDVVEADDAYTGLHSRDVVELSVAVAGRLGLSADEVRDTEFVALLHDVGKIRMPSEVINKNGPLTPDERAIMETHTIEGERLLEQVGGLLGRVGRIVRSCHERWDGNGYPDGLAGEAIPRLARIVACCDAFSAMTTDRSYRKALSVPRALGELRANAGTQFDPEVVDALVAVVEQDALARPAAAMGTSSTR
jgi:HD-GYP domain-containing protein (c-di-GMP phosphodiesterase class II)